MAVVWLGRQAYAGEAGRKEIEFLSKARFLMIRVDGCRANEPKSVLRSPAVLPKRTRLTQPCTLALSAPSERSPAVWARADRRSLREAKAVGL